MVRHDNLVFCQPPDTASAATGPTHLRFSRICMPRQPPCVKATQATLPTGYLPRISERENGHNTETQHALTHLYRPLFRAEYTQNSHLWKEPLQQPLSSPTVVYNAQRMNGTTKCHVCVNLISNY